MSTKLDYMSDTWKDGIFDNKVVFCTGGAGTICSAQVRALVHLGANACIVGRNVEKTERAAQEIATVRPGAKVIGVGAVDVRKVESLQDAVERCVKEFGGIDFVIAGAAGNFLASINQLSVNAFKSVIDIDVLGSYNTLKATLPYLVESANKHKVDSKTLKPSPAGTGGRIIFISATLHYRTTPFQAHVSVAKAGIDALSHTVALEFGPLGVTSNIISPGPIASTEGMDRLLPSDTKESYLKSQPLGRLGSVSDIADATVYLFSSTGSYVSGQVLVGMPWPPSLRTPYPFRKTELIILVDGASWRMGSGSFGELKYPDFLLSGDAVPNVKGAKSKL